jgi:hypothetical protein
VKLDSKSLEWDLEVQATALRAGWTVYPQSLRNRRQQDPSMVLVRGSRLIAAYLRLNARRPPAVGKAEQLLGVRTVLWTPADRRVMAAELVSPS